VQLNKALNLIKALNSVEIDLPGKQAFALRRVTRKLEEAGKDYNAAITEWAKQHSGELKVNTPEYEQYMQYLTDMLESEIDIDVKPILEAAHIKRVRNPAALDWLIDGGLLKDPDAQTEGESGD